MIKRWIAAWMFARYLFRRASKRSVTVIRRKADGSWWTASSPQNMGYAMRGLFARKSQWHFCKAREWRGLLIVSRKVFWLPDEGREFEVLFETTGFRLPPWPEAVECAKIDCAKPYPVNMRSD